MNITLENILCHQSKAFTLMPGVNLVTGKNSAGKTSVATALAALSTHTTNPKGVSATDQKSYVFDGMGSGCATLEINGEPEAKTQWRPGQGVEHTRNAKPLSTKQAVGAYEFTRNTTPKELAKMWESMFLPDDPEEILRPHWRGLSEMRMEGLLKLINDRGWPDAVAVIEGQRRDVKRRWSEIAGEAFGDKKALAWTPPHWRDELNDKSESGLREEIEFCQQTLNSARIEQGIDHEKVKAIAEKKNRVIGLKAQIDAALKKSDAANVDVVNLDAEVRSLNESIATHALNQDRFQRILIAKAPHACPQCNHGLELTASGVKSWASPTADDVQGAQDGLKTSIEQQKIQSDERSGLNLNLDLAKKGYGELKAVHSNLVAEQRVLESQIAEGAGEVSDGGGMSEKEHAKIETQLAGCRLDLEAFTRKQSADVEYASFVELDSLCTILGPNGARASIMSGAMDGVRKKVAELCATAEWASIGIRQDYRLMSNDRPIQLCAHNEKMKAQWALQIVSARISECRLVVLDAADLLRDESWDGMIRYLNVLADECPDMVIVVAATSTDCPDGWNKVQV